MPISCVASSRCINYHGRSPTGNSSAPVHVQSGKNLRSAKVVYAALQLELTLFSIAYFECSRADYGQQA